MIKIVKIEDIKPAPYNPRQITEEQIEKLEESFTKIGFVVPVLVNKKNNVIIAGHQRTKTAKRIGINEVPAMYVDDIDLGDEIKFNQIHNSIDIKASRRAKLLQEHPQETFIEVGYQDFTSGNPNPVVTKEICKLIMKYGNVLSCVVCRKEVLLGNEYVHACKLLKIDVNTFICDDSKYEDINYYFNLEYGKYFYDNLKKDTYVQGLAQMFRNVEQKKGLKRQNASKLYTEWVLPYLQGKDDLTILDFGCDKGAYITMLQKKMTAVGVEFYNNNGSAINVSKGNSQVDDLIKYLNKRKTFDVVVCDSVMNSVDSMDAEHAILSCLNLFTNDRLFISGRCLDFIKGRARQKKDSGVTQNYLYFLDDNNFTATYRKGKWYYQHFHEKEAFEKELAEFGFEVVNQNWVGSSFQVECKKVRELTKEQYIKGIDFEFNLPLPFGESYKRHEDVKKALTLS